LNSGVITIPDIASAMSEVAMIIEAYSGYVKLDIAGRVVTVSGERYSAGFGNPTFVAYISSIDKWDDGKIVLPYDVELITNTLKKDFADKGWTLECE
jgi:uncharacterized membrane protein